VKERLLILLGHEEENRRKAINKSISVLNADVIEVETGEEVIEEAKKETFSCIIISYCLPDYESFALVNELRLQGTPTPIIIVSEYKNKFVVFTVKNGSTNYIPKNNSMPKILAAAIEDVTDFYKIPQSVEGQIKLLKTISEAAKNCGHYVAAM